MPFFSRFRSSLPGEKGSKSPTSPLSPRSPKSPKPPHSPGVGLSKAKRNSDYLYQCAGCNHIDSMIRRNLGAEESGHSNIGKVLLHDSFEELNECALTCETCRVFRQSLILEEVLFDEVRKLQKAPGSISVGWKEEQVGPNGRTQYLTVEIQGRDGVGMVTCHKDNDTSHVRLSSNMLDPAVVQQASNWLKECLHNHVGDCDNLRWNDETPELLVEIRSSTTVRLRSNHRQNERYVALSYCWGDSSKYEDWEAKQVSDGETRFKNLKRRMEKDFPLSELPTTVADTLKFLHTMNIQYAWIDTLCINQDTKDGIETMHKVYSNALFTLCACATTKATSNLLDRRLAWIDSIKPCRLGERWLTTTDMSMNELRLRSPLALRAWTLQEERLSPRILYLASNRMYWSCSQVHDVELAVAHPEKAHTASRPTFAVSDRHLSLPQSQQFLQACYRGELRSLPSLWNDIVKSYSLRGMGNKGDRLTAVSGLAAKYLRAAPQDRYMAGLWKNNLAEGLAWRVRQAVARDHDLIKWPTWSWAIISIQTAIDINEGNSASMNFCLVEGICHIDTDRDTVGEIIAKGQQLKEICVSGEVRKLWKVSTQRVEWSTISRSVNGEERFTFTLNSQQDVHAIDGKSGRILVYEDQKRAVVTQIDFRENIERLQSQSLELLALKIGQTTMLVLEHCGGGMCQRVGVAWDVREDYFTQADVRSLVLR